jgi:hypothetical protein
MRFWSKLKDVKRLHEEAQRRNEALGEVAQRDGEVSEALLAITTRQAEVLTVHNTKNHYSESLTHAFRGKTA